MRTGHSIRYIAVSQPGPTKKRNEDALLIDGEVYQGSVRLAQSANHNDAYPKLYAIADGMAGSPYPHIGSGLLLQILYKSVQTHQGNPENLRQCLLNLQDDFVTQARKRKCTGTAATLAGVIVEDSVVKIFNAGDSRVYGIRDDQITQLSRDHTELADMIDSGEIEPMSVKDAPSSFLEPSSFYMADPMHSLTRVFQRTLKTDETNVVLICSDGLVDTLKDDELIPAGQLEIEALFSLISEARKRGGMDDISVIAIDLSETGRKSV